MQSTRNIKANVSNDLLNDFYEQLKMLVDLHSVKDGSSETFSAMAADMVTTEPFQRMIRILQQVDVYAESFSTYHSANGLLDALSPMRRLRTIINMNLGTVFNLVAQVIHATDSDHGPDWKSFAQSIVRSDRATVLVADLLRQSGKNQDLVADFERLEKENPHAIYPTSSYRESRGHVVSSDDDQRVEAVMTSKTFTSIVVTEDVLSTESTVLSQVYEPLGRCVALVDTNVEEHFGTALDAYFKSCDIPLIKLVYRAMEVDKGINTVEKMLGDFKKFGVSRNEAVLIAGGGVLCDTGGLACALYHRNTPYVMLSTSIVAGLDAGPSPRTCCDGFGYKNLFGSYHTPILSITDRSFFKTLKTGWVRHGISEIIKMATVKDAELFKLLEAAGPALVDTRFGTINCEPTDLIVDQSRKIIAAAVRSYVEAEYGNLYETHQCRPHAYGHTWSPGFEIPAGLLHGHAISVGMGLGAFMSCQERWITHAELQRILNLIGMFGLSLWHPILDDTDVLWEAQVKMVQKRGGNLAAPLPKGAIGQCGYLNEMSREKLVKTIKTYKSICKRLPQEGLGIDPHCADVGLEDPSTVAESNLVSV